MYFDTLKVSTVEQSAEQTSARGGLGNPELISWDFGKEITVNLEDALYTPASQSLMWGGKFGVKKTKIYGVWNPYVYPTDRQGKQIYSKRIPIELGIIPDPEYEDQKVVRVINENKLYDIYISEHLNYGTSDKDVKDITLPDNYKPLSSTDYFYKITEGEDDEEYYLVVLSRQGDGWSEVPSGITGTINENNEFQITNAYIGLEYQAENSVIFITCPCDGMQKAFEIKPEDGHYKYYHDKETWKEEQLILTEYNCPSDNIINESEEISRSVGKYTISDNHLNSDTYWNEKPERAIITVDAFGQFTYHAYEFVSKEEDEQEICYYKDIDFCDEAAIKCTDERIDAYGYIWENSDLKMVSLEENQDLFYLKDTDLRYRIRVDNGLREVALEYHKDNENNYQPKIDVYKNITYTTLNSDGIEEKHTLKVLAGSFYIIDDWNLSGAAPQEFIYEIESGLNNVNYLERMEKCRAKQTFAIDADKNTRCNNYRYDKAYDNTALTVFINPKTMKPYESNSDYYQTKSGQVIEGNLTIIKQNETYYKWIRSKAADYTSLGYQIVVDAEHYPGTYKLVGETYARAYSDGQDRRYQFEIPLCKMSSDTTVTLEAAGEPTTFNMSFKVLRKDDGTMMKITQYNVSENMAGSTDVISDEALYDENILDFGSSESTRIETRYGEKSLKLETAQLEIVNPTDSTVYYVSADVDAPFEGQSTLVSKIADSDLEHLIDNWRVETSDSTETVQIYNESLKNDANLTSRSNDIIVKEISSYEQMQEQYEVEIDGAGNEKVVPGSIRTVPTGKTVISTKFLSSNEYSFTTNNGVITVTTEGGE